MKKLGMQLEGVQRSHTKDDDGNWADLYLYGLFKNDWHVL
jgi:RimJ/RimL family protein N-acetyltransferase